LNDREAMRQQRREIDPPVLDQFHQAPHPLLSARAECRYDLVFSQTRRERIQRN
jgi:hypothetical protein